ncbi:MAG TPA: glycine rich domain-containing protein [Bacteroidales bacterium]|nr:glycine rich domain-containing protein [Bacteroidales bacterium]HPS61977.1 glycine rich domain-containing protein [Bacteroidales bacterium]
MKNVFALIFIFAMPLLVFAQTPKVSDLEATGTNLKWYTNPTGGTALDPATPLIHGQHYYSSQTVDGVESLTRFEVIANLSSQTAPAEGSHTATSTQIIWSWSPAPDAAGYRWNAINEFATATNLETDVTYTETGLACGTSYTRYVWAYNSAGCNSPATTLTQVTTSCASAPSVTTDPATAVSSTGATLNGNITATGGATVTVRGFKYSTTSGFDPATSGANVSETGSFSTGTYSFAVTGLSTGTPYYVKAYAINTAGTTYGDQVTFTPSNANSWTFTNASASGKSGPTQAQVNTAYTGTSLEGSVTVSPQGVQSWTVPLTGSYRIEAWGAGGGANYPTQRVRGGYGARIAGTFSLTAGQVIKIVVGQRGTDGAEDNYSSATAPQSCGGSGGGGSFVTLSDNTPLIVAGGGGGATTRVSYTGQIGGDGLVTNNGGDATGACAGNGGTAGSGGEASCNPGYQGGAGGGGLTGAGGNTIGNLMYGPISLGGSAFTGGSAGGAGGTGGPAGNCRDGGFGGGGAGGYDGGGGGGYSGGGGGGDDGSGGGGSYNGGTNPFNQSGYNNDQGKVIILRL